MDSFLCDLYSTRRVQLESVFLLLIFAASVDYQMRSGTTVPLWTYWDDWNAWQLPAAHEQWQPVSRPGSTERRIQRWLSTTACQLWTAAGGLYIQLCHAGPLSPQIRSHNTYVNNVHSYHWSGTVCSSPTSVFSDPSSPLKISLFIQRSHTCRDGQYYNNLLKG